MIEPCTSNSAHKAQWIERPANMGSQFIQITKVPSPHQHGRVIHWSRHMNTPPLIMILARKPVTIFFVDELNERGYKTLGMYKY